MAVTTAGKRSAPRWTPERRRRLLREMRKEWTAYLFLAPGLLLFAVFVVFGVSFSLWLSFREWNVLEPEKPFVGLENYRELLQDRRFLQAIGNTLYFCVTVPLSMGIGLLVALLLNNQIRGRGFFRTLYYMPAVTSAVAAAVVWKWIFNGDYGLLNYYLIRLGVISEPVLWLSDRNTAMPAVIMVAVWGGVAGQMVMFLAGLQAIPQEMYDAAKVDGANGLQRLFRITIPLLSPTIFFLFVTSMIGALQQFAIPFLMTGGGPLGRTTTVGYRVYTEAFREFEMGYASAMAYVLFAMMVVFTFMYWRRLYREIEY